MGSRRLCNALASLYWERGVFGQNSNMVDDRTNLMSARALGAGYEILWYTIERVLGQGGFGITYLAHDRNLERSVAIKEYLPTSFAYRHADYSVKPITGDHRENFSWGLGSFLKEAQTLARFSHPNIVRVHSVFEENNTAYMVMEYEHGRNLGSVYQQRSHLDQKFFDQVFFPIFDGLKEIHNFGFIHRDIKPANIYIRDDNTPVLIDFGSARQTSQQQTGEMTTLVSHGYTPLEQYSANYGDQGPWTDIYALAATMYEGVAGQKPEESLGRAGSLMRTKQDSLIRLDTQDYPQFNQMFLDAVYAGLKLEPEGRPRNLQEWSELFQTGSLSLAAVSDSSESGFTQFEDDDKTRIHPARRATASAAAPVSSAQPFDSPDLSFEDDEFYSDTRDRIETTMGRKHPPVQAKKSALPRLIGAGVFCVLAVAAGGWFLLTTGQGSSNQISPDKLASMPKPPQNLELTLPKVNILKTLDNMQSMAGLLSRAHSVNPTDERVLTGIRETESGLIEIARNWNATRHGEIASKIQSVSLALPASVHDSNRVSRIIEASDQLSQVGTVMNLIEEGAYLAPAGNSVLDKITSVNSNEFSTLKNSDEWDEMMSGFKGDALNAIEASRFDEAARLVAIALTFDENDSDVQILRNHLTSP